mmetsp:Transcript_34006/g.56302  ORF Transcript_34006/g.56302 Transcript_34006/m.56302 type:complete len:96 (+) Transcript_34006:1468-1755(+)
MTAEGPPDVAVVGSLRRKLVILLKIARSRSRFLGRECVDCNFIPTLACWTRPPWITSGKVVGCTASSPHVQAAHALQAANMVLLSCSFLSRRCER